jgi:hypothetical protein
MPDRSFQQAEGLPYIRTPGRQRYRRWQPGTKIKPSRRNDAIEALRTVRDRLAKGEHTASERA